MTPADLATENARDAARLDWLLENCLYITLPTGTVMAENSRTAIDAAMGDMSPTHLQAPDMSPKG